MRAAKQNTFFCAILLQLVTIYPAIAGGKSAGRRAEVGMTEEGYCQSWRVAVEANNVRYFHTVPPQCLSHVKDYMLTNGQYLSDMDLVVAQATVYLDGISASDDGMDAWILDVDDTCISNLFYYQRRRYGGEPFDPWGFKRWAEQKACPAIPAVIRLYRRLIRDRFKVFLITGREEELLGPPTAENLLRQGFVGHERLIMRASEYRGQSAVVFKTAIRRQLMEKGYRIRGNVGDQWSDLLGDCVGERTFKLPNPMYFVP